MENVEKILAGILNAFSTLDDNNLTQNRASSHSWPAPPSSQEHEGQSSYPQSSVQGIRIPSESIVSAVDMDTASTTPDRDAVCERYGILSQCAHILGHLIKKVGMVVERLQKLVPTWRGYDVRKIAMLMLISILLYHLCATFIHTLQVDHVIE
jgi:hypothetical protein